MSPSFRDLKGKPVEEVIDSRAIPGLPDPGQQMVERDLVRQAVEKMTASRGRFTPPDDNVSQQPGVVTDAWAGMQSGPEPFERATLDPESSTLRFRQPVPEDMAQALAELEATVAIMREHAQAALVAAGRCMVEAQAVRERAEKDSAKLAKLGQMLKSLDE